MSRRIAYLIGVTDYDEDRGFAPLPVAKTDVETLQEALESSDYDCIARCGYLSRSEILELIGAQLQTAGESDTLIIYFSGHGIYHGHTTYLVPSDGGIRNPINQQCHPPTELANFNVSLEALRQYIADCLASNIIFIVDSCREGINFYIEQLQTKGLTQTVDDYFTPQQLQIHDNKSVWFLFACAAGHTAAYGNVQGTEISYFTYAVSQAMSNLTPPETVDQIASFARDEIKRIKPKDNHDRIRCVYDGSEEAKSRIVCNSSSKSSPRQTDQLIEALANTTPHLKISDYIESHLFRFAIPTQLEKPFFLFTTSLISLSVFLFFYDTQAFSFSLKYVAIFLLLLSFLCLGYTILSKKIQQLSPGRKSLASRRIAFWRVLSTQPPVDVFRLLVNRLLDEVGSDIAAYDGTNERIRQLEEALEQIANLVSGLITRARVAQKNNATSEVRKAATAHTEFMRTQAQYNNELSELRKYVDPLKDKIEIGKQFAKALMSEIEHSRITSRISILTSMKSKSPEHQIIARAAFAYLEFYTLDQRSELIEHSKAFNIVANKHTLEHQEEQLRNFESLLANEDQSSAN